MTTTGQSGSDSRIPAQTIFSGPQTGAGRGGFALITTLSLLVLLLVIVVGILTLSTIEVRSAGWDKDRAVAEANARLALLLAIGDLQKEFGPDQRVSARAAILDEDTSDPDPSSIAHAHWLGSWESWQGWLNSPDIVDTYDRGRQNRFRKWLVSQPDPASLEDLSLVRQPLPTGAVMLVGARSTDSDDGESGKVEVPAIRTSNGRIAWWVNGENQKARVNLSAGEASGEAGRLHARSQWPQGRADWLDGLEGVPGDANAVAKTVTVPTLGVSATGEEARDVVRARLHDLTTDSMGLAVNVRKGGMKKDLNLLLERDSLPEEFGTYSGAQPGGSIVPIRPHDSGHLPSLVYPQNQNFPSWYKLHQYYQLYRGGGDETEADSTPVPFRGAGVWGSASSPNINFNWHRQNLDYFGVGRTPIVTRLMMVFSTRRVRSADGVNYDYKLGVNPVVCVWNPYNLTLHSPRLWIRIVPGALQDKAYVNGSERVPWRQLSRASGGFEVNVYPMEGPALHTTPIVLKPGETRIFSAVSGFLNANGFRHVELYPGYEPPDKGGGFEVDLSGLTGLPATSRVELAMRMSDSRALHGGQYQIYWTVRNAQTGESQRYNELAANPVMDATPIYLAEDSPGKRVVFSQSAIRVPFANFQFVMKSGQDLRNPGTAYSTSDFRCRNFIHANPLNQRAMYGEATERMRGLAQYHVQMESGSGNALNPDFELSSNRSYIGSAISLAEGAWPGQTRAVLGEFPVVPVTSLASLMHFKLIPGDSRNFATGRHLWEVSANQAIAIGNSFAHPLIPGDAIYHDVADASCRGAPIQMKLIRDFHDHGFLNNDALWDDWFCSGITREDEGLITTGRDLKQVVREFADGEAPAWNPHLLSWRGPSSADEELEDLLLNGKNPSEEAHRIVGGHVMIKGAFNINSTSVEAWKAFLAGLQDESIDYIDPDTGSVSTASIPEGHVLLSRYSLPASPDEGKNAGDPNSWLGVRKLTPEQVDRLARECVRQVKERGPFLNLSDFVNRRLADDETGVCGALQAAIDWDEFLDRSPEPSNNESINGRFKGGDDYIEAAKVASWDLPFPDAATGSRYAGIPGYLTQGDVLKRVGNMITPRDDTFRIRGYGESIGPSGEVRARAWCEAIVQRVPEFLEATDEPETAAKDIQSVINRTFGRRFELVSFRWLSPEEI